MNDINSDVYFERLRRYVLPSRYDNQINDTSSVTFPDDLIAPQEIGKIAKFFEKANLINNKKLVDVFTNIDNNNRVKLDVPLSTEVVQTVEAFVENLLDKIAQIDPRFKSSLIRAGSFYDGVKIGKPDEFDFSARIDSLCISEGLEARLSHKKKGFVYVVVTNKKLMNEFKEFFIPAGKDAVLLENEVILSVGLIQGYFRDLMARAVKSIDFPKGILPSEKNFSSSFEQHGPSTTFYATLCSKEFGEMKVDIDIVPTFDFPNVSYRPPVLDIPLQESQFLSYLKDILLNNAKIMLVPFPSDGIKRNVDDKSWNYEYSNTWRVSFNELEKAVFSLYDTDSVEKRIYRILKVFKETYIQKSKQLEEKAGTRSIKCDEPPSIRVSIMSLDLSEWCLKAINQPYLSQENVKKSDDYEEYSSTFKDYQSNSDTSHSDGVEVLYERSWANKNTSGVLSGKYVFEGTRMNIGDGHNDDVEMLNESSLLKDNSLRIADESINEAENEIFIKTSRQNRKDNFEASVESFSDFSSNLEYRSSNPLIKTYHLKMILFFMKMVFPEREIWKKECLPLLVLLVVKMLYYIHSSKYRDCNNFWFQEMIESGASPSVSKEIVQSLTDLLDDLDQKTDCS